MPALKVVDAADVMAKAPLCTVRVNGWVTVAPTWLLALKLKAKVPTLAALTVPARVAVPFGPGVKVTPDGKAPDSESVAGGIPLVLTTNIAGWPRMNVADDAEVNTGGAVTVRVKAWVVVPSVVVAEKVKL